MPCQLAFPNKPFRQFPKTHYSSVPSFQHSLRGVGPTGRRPIGAKPVSSFVPPSLCSPISSPKRIGSSNFSMRSRLNDREFWNNGPLILKGSLSLADHMSTWLFPINHRASLPAPTSGPEAWKTENPKSSIFNIQYSIFNIQYSIT